MMSRLEKIGLKSILEEKFREATEKADRAYTNSEMQDQAQAYRDGQYNEYRYYRGRADGLEEAIVEVGRIETQ